MKHTNEKIINVLISIAQIIPNPFSDGQPNRSFGVGKYNISFVGYENIVGIR